MTAETLRAKLLAWYDAGARNLAWRVGPADNRAGVRADPYRIWLSEVMLQQTTVPHATPYFLKFTARWPTVMDLAAEEDGEVMAAWAGLGYYARARNLLACARAVASQHGGVFPNTEEGLRALPGLGPFTAAAPSAKWSQYKAILLDFDLWRINLTTFTALYGFWVAVTWGPTFLKVERGFSLGASGFFTGLIAVSAIPASMFWGRMADRIGRKKVALFVLPASAFILLLLSLLEGYYVLIGLLVLFGMLSNTAFVPSMLAWSADIVEKRHPGLTGASVGIFNASIMLSAVVAPVVSGFLRDQTGSLGPALTAASLLMLGGTLLLLTIPAVNPRNQ